MNCCLHPVAIKHGRYVTCGTCGKKMTLTAWIKVGGLPRLTEGRTMKNQDNTGDKAEECGPVHHWLDPRQMKCRCGLLTTVPFFTRSASLGSPETPQESGPRLTEAMTNSVARFNKLFVPITYEPRDGDTLAVRMCKKIYNLTHRGASIGPDELRTIHSAAFAGLEGEDEIDSPLDAPPETPQEPRTDTESQLESLKWRLKSSDREFGRLRNLLDNFDIPHWPLSATKARLQRMYRAWNVPGADVSLTPYTHDEWAAETPQEDAAPPKRSIKQLRDVLSMLCHFIWYRQTRPGEHMWSIPVDKERDFDCILSDAIDELEQLRAKQPPSLLAAPPAPMHPRHPYDVEGSEYLPETCSHQREHRSLICRECALIGIRRLTAPSLLAAPGRVREIVGRILWSKVTEIGGGKCYLKTNLDNVADELEAALAPIAEPPA